MRKYQLLCVIILVFSCTSNSVDSRSYVHIRDFLGGENVKISGKILINQPLGFTKIESDTSLNNKDLVIAVHGYDSRGYEWVEPLNKLSKTYKNVLFYRNDWNICPDLLAKNLNDSINDYLSNSIDFTKIIIFGHSYGGLILTYLASELQIDFPIEIHTIASPLKGYPRIMDNCDFQYDSFNTITYPEWQDNIAHYQWRTVKEQDRAYKDLQYDPQNISIKNSTVTVLPDSMDGHRLGHNWSVTWVVNNYLESNI